MFKSQKIASLGAIGFFLCLMLLFQNCAKKSDDASPVENPCTTLDCTTLKYSLIVADLDGSNVSLIKTSSYQNMTHPRVSNDKNWVAYTTYNTRNSSGCADLDIGYFNTEIRAVQINGTNDKRIIAPVSTEFNSNSYWIGTTNEFTYLSGPVPGLKFYRSTVDSSMNLISGPTEIPVAGAVTVPMDPAAHAGTDKIVFPGMYNPGGGYVKSIFIMNLSDSGNLVGLSLGRDHAGGTIICNADCSNIMENDPKISPDGTNVAFMRSATSSGANGFGWHIFVVPVASPLNEVDISYSAIGSDILKNEGLPEWIDDNTLVFSTIDVISATNFTKDVYTMKSDGTQRTKISLPSGYKYSDVFPFVDGTGKQRLVISAEKIGASCF